MGRAWFILESPALISDGGEGLLPSSATLRIQDVLLPAAAHRPTEILCFSCLMNAVPCTLLVDSHRSEFVRACVRTCVLSRLKLTIQP